ncbi:hypothetical protein [Enorma phocaeensis]|uniref:hypothetical protein n=1 Tax=Enorma phocaeensis TaxID=1871019 RepID=UPI00195EC4D3|nr:hypothetical protein [Enorma phocaeensis]MBM6953470.1 restriction endonuclease subunit M [Enorma phocaeensis]
MALLRDAAQLISGTPQFRITEDWGDAAPRYVIYSQMDLEDDSRGLITQRAGGKQVKTWDVVVTASTGDVIFSLLSGTAVIAQAEHHGYLLTQNYIKLIPVGEIDAFYLVYLLNENRLIRRQLRVGQQGSSTMKYTLRQLRELELPQLPSLKRQELIGRAYACQLKLDALRKRMSERETILVREMMRRADRQ